MENPVLDPPPHGAPDNTARTAANQAVSTSRAVSGSQRLSELTHRVQHREADELAQGLARAFAVGGFIYILFFFVDALVRETDTPLWVPLILRIVGGAAMLFAGRELARRRLSLGATVALASATIALTAKIAALIAGLLGGLDSALTAGLAFYFLGAATFGPSPWPRMLWLTLPSWVTYFVTLLITSPIPEDGLPRALFADMLVTLGLLLFAAAGGEILYRSRRHIAEVRRLGRYRLDTLLERDALSETWRAHDTKSGADVALELYRARPLGDPSLQVNRVTGEHGGTRILDDALRERFVAAANAVAALGSPYAMRVFDCGANDDGIAFIARDFIAGERLDSLVRRAGPLEAHRAISIARQLATALSEAHKKGIAHRDLRPWNVFVAPDHEGRDAVRLIGWGLPDLVRSHEARDALLIGRGPGLFHAPEWPLGSGVRCDVYGLGALLYWSLTGQPPVELKAGEAPWRAHARSVVQRPSTLRGELLPAGLDALVIACLERDPLGRPADATRVLELLLALPVPR